MYNRIRRAKTDTRQQDPRGNPHPSLGISTL
jgi:hypothetical protein